MDDLRENIKVLVCVRSSCTDSGFGGAEERLLPFRTSHATLLSLYFKCLDVSWLVSCSSDVWLCHRSMILQFYRPSEGGSYRYQPRKDSCELWLHFLMLLSSIVELLTLHKQQLSKAVCFLYRKHINYFQTMFTVDSQLFLKVLFY